MSMDSGIVRRKAWFLLAAMLCAALAITATPYRSAAQEEEEAPAVENAPNAQEAPATADNADAVKTETVKGENFLVWVVKVSGIMGLVLLLLSIYFVSTVGRLFYEMRLETAIPPKTIQMILPMRLGTPACGFGTAVRPKGHSA